MFKLRFPRLDWLEALLVAAVVVLFFQLFPSVWWSLLRGLDPRGWSRATWFTLNLLILLVLFGIKLGPGLVEDFRQQRATKRTKQRAKGPGANASALADDDYQARLRRDAEWRERAQKRHPWR